MRHSGKLWYIVVPLNLIFPPSELPAYGIFSKLQQIEAGTPSEVDIADCHDADILRVSDRGSCIVTLTLRNQSL